MVLFEVVLYLVTSLTLASGANPLGMIKKNMPQLNAQVEKLEQCQEFPDTPLMFQDLVISQIGFNQYILKGKLVIKETLDKPIHIVLEMFRCKSKEDPTSCEYYFTFKKSGICDLMKQSDKSWDYFTNGTDLPHGCPYPPKVYTVNGSTVDLHKLNFVPFFQSYWRVKNKIFMGKKLMLCIITEFSLQMVKRH